MIENGRQGGVLLRILIDLFELRFWVHFLRSIWIIQVESDFSWLLCWKTTIKNSPLAMRRLHGNWFEGQTAVQDPRSMFIYCSSNLVHWINIFRLIREIERDSCRKHFLWGQWRRIQTRKCQDFLDFQPLPRIYIFFFVSDVSTYQNRRNIFTSYTHIHT